MTFARSNNLRSNLELAWKAAAFPFGGEDISQEDRNGKGPHG